MQQVERIRGRKLQALRARHFAANPLCVMCEAKTPPRITLATQLDHILALTNGGTNSDDNYQGLCDECHKDKTAKDKGHRVKRRIGLDGWPVGAGQKSE